MATVRGKKIDVWRWTDQAYGASTVIEVPVHMFKDEHHISFGVRLDQYHIQMFDKDIDKLRRSVFDALRDWFSIEWKPFYVVTVGGWQKDQNCHIPASDRITDEVDIDEREGVVEVTFQYLLVEIGSTKTGSKVWREGTGTGSYRTGELLTGEWVEGMRHQAGSSLWCFNRSHSRPVRSILPATEENCQLLESFRQKMVRLEEALRTAFHPDRIVQTLLKQMSQIQIPEIAGGTDQNKDATANAQNAQKD